MVVWTFDSVQVRTQCTNFSGQMGLLFDSMTHFPISDETGWYQVCSKDSLYLIIFVNENPARLLPPDQCDRKLNVSGKTPNGNRSPDRNVGVFDNQGKWSGEPVYCGLSSVSEPTVRTRSPKKGVCRNSVSTPA